MDTKEESIKIISIEDFKKYKEETNAEHIEYVDDNVVVARNAENLPFTSRMLRLNLFLIVACTEGKIQLSVNGKDYQVQEGEALVCMPTMILSNLLFSLRHKVSIVGFSVRFLQQTIQRGKSTEKALYYIYKNPVFAQSVERNDREFSDYYRLITGRIADTAHPYRQEILEHLFSALFHEMLADVRKYSDESQGMLDTDAGRSKRIFRQFINEVSKDGGMHRAVSYYADRLCYTPKYISSAIKEVSGRTPTEWINEYAIEQIKYQLRHSEKSVKEIAEMFNFPNQSFFGKYVKAHIGMSPARYRAYSANEEEQSSVQTES